MNHQIAKCVRLAFCLILLHKVNKKGGHVADILDK